MTTTSSLPFPTMEVPAAEDSMEMASPYQGQADDFDIDIDIMEDQVSNMDSDMMGADDYPTSQPSLFPNDASNDADMADGPSEGSMVDADEYVDEDQDIEVQDEVTFEAEMQEGDQSINVGASDVPTIQIDTAAEEGPEPVQNVTEAVEQVGPQKTEEDASDLAKISSTDLQPQSGEIHEQDTALEPSEAETGGPAQPEVKVTAQVDVETHATELAEEKNDTTGSKGLGAEGSEGHAEPVTEDSNTSQAQPAAHDAKAEHVEDESHHLHHAADQDRQHDESLHPVKVIYQDNEISLFPPLEGDSAETFFLHDEDVAYDTVGKMFGSLREVLLDNVAENEILVIDIDSLGIQLTEDSSSTSKITLHQILDIYLRLCHNDGTDEPEALYLTLTSKLGVDSELEGLSAAASEGKGLSQIHAWSEVDDDGACGGEVPPQEPAQPAEESHVDQTYPDQSVPQDREDVEGEASLGDGPLSKAVETAPEEAYSAPSAAEQVAEVKFDSQTVEDDGQHAQVDEAQARQLSNEAQPTHADDQDDDRYDSEAHKTESSATVVEGAATNEHAGNASAEDVEGVVEHDGADDLADDGANQENIDQEQIETFHYDEHDDFAYEESLTEENDDHGQGVLQHESIHETDVAPEDDSASAAKLAADDEHVPLQPPESTFEEAVQEDATYREHTPEAEDDFLEIAEDLLQTPAKNHSESQHEHAEGTDPEQSDEYEDEENANDDGLAAPSADQDGADECQSTAEDYDDYYPPPDLEVTEALELDGTETTLDNLSTKRSRDDEEEWDIADTTTPDTKRRRS